MKIKLYDYSNTAVWVNIPEDANVVCGLVVSGDMIVNYPIVFDTGEGTRWNHYIDGYWKVDVAELEKFNSMKNYEEVLKNYSIE